MSLSNIKYSGDGFSIRVSKTGPIDNASGNVANQIAGDNSTQSLTQVAGDQIVNNFQSAPALADSSPEVLGLVTAIAGGGDDAHRYLDYIDLHLASCSPVMYQALQMLIRYDAIKDESDLDRAIRLATDVFVRHETLCNGLSEGMEDWNL